MTLSRNTEYGSSMYLIERGRKTYLTFTYPKGGESDKGSTFISEPPNGETIIAIIHSHGAGISGGINDEFSNNDYGCMKAYRAKRMFVSTPVGGLHMGYYNSQKRKESINLGYSLPSNTYLISSNAKVIYNEFRSIIENSVTCYNAYFESIGGYTPVGHYIIDQNNMKYMNSLP